MKFYFIIFFVLLILGCKRSVTTDNISTKEAAVIQHTKFDEDWEERGNKLRDTNYQYLNRMLDKVLQTTEQHKYDYLFNGSIDTSVYHYKNMNATFHFGNIFSPDKKHLIVKRFINEYEGFEVSLFTDIYILKNNHFKKVVADSAGYGYREDTLIDINLDGFKDYMVSQYSSAGCCPRDDRKAYLYDTKSGGLKATGFFNPEFDNANKLIYEMDYGHPGEVSIEKSKWVGLLKIKIESICPTHFEDRIDSFARPYSYTKTRYPSEKQVILKDLPKEYKRLENLEYFLSYQR
jgi:hypothetical protein